MNLSGLHILTCSGVLGQEYVPKLVSDLSGNSDIRNYFAKSKVAFQPPTTKGQGGFQGSIQPGTALLSRIGRNQSGKGGDSESSRYQYYFGGVLR